MIKSILILFLFTTNFLLLGCSNKEIIDENKINLQNPSLLYSSAMQDLDDEKYEDANLKFKNLIYLFPLSNEGIQSQIMIAFIDYIKMDYVESIYKFNKIIKLYPSHKNIDYVYYMKAMCYFEQIESESLDGFNNQKSLMSFNELINRFPESNYARDSQQKIIFIKENIAAKHMNIGRFYLNQKKYLAALNRFNIIINEYSKSKFTPEALYRLIEIYYTLGMHSDAEKTAKVIAYNYPKSQWYDYAYKLVVKKKENKKNVTFANKLLNLLRQND